MKPECVWLPCISKCSHFNCWLYYHSRKCHISRLDWIEFNFFTRTLHEKKKIHSIRGSNGNRFNAHNAETINRKFNLNDAIETKSLEMFFRFFLSFSRPISIQSTEVQYLWLCRRNADGKSANHSTISCISSWLIKNGASTSNDKIELIAKRERFTMFEYARHTQTHTNCAGKITNLRWKLML